MLTGNVAEKVDRICCRSGRKSPKMLWELTGNVADVAGVDRKCCRSGWVMTGNVAEVAGQVDKKRCGSGTSLWHHQVARCGIIKALSGRDQYRLLPEPEWQTRSGVGLQYRSTTWLESGRTELVHQSPILSLISGRSHSFLSIMPDPLNLSTCVCPLRTR